MDRSQRMGSNVTVQYRRMDSGPLPKQTKSYTTVPSSAHQELPAPALGGCLNSVENILQETKAVVPEEETGDGPTEPPQHSRQYSWIWPPPSRCTGETQAAVILALAALISATGFISIPLLGQLLCCHFYLLWHKLRIYEYIMHQWQKQEMNSSRKPKEGDTPHAEWTQMEQEASCTQTPMFR